MSVTEKDPATGYSSSLSPDAERNGSTVEKVNAEFTSQGLQRKLKARHVQMIAIGSNIGTGLFIGSGKSLATGGPLGLVLGFVLISIALPLMMHCLGEMSCVLPISGAFTRYASRFYDESLGFAIGWQYWLAWVSVFGAEASAFVILINYWDDNPAYTPLWISIFIIINICIHASPVRVFGEVEFWVSALKVVSVTAFIVVTWAIMGGAGSKGFVHGAEYWHLPGLNNGLASGFKGLASVFVNAGFAAGGVEMVGIAAGEAQQPLWNLPRAIKTLMWRVIIFYVFSMIFLSFVVPYTDDNLLGNANAKSSPFVIAILNAGIKVLPDILNAVVMICVCSVGSSSIYISSRTLHAMGEDGFAFSFFARTDSKGRPYYALLFTAAIAIILAYINCSNTGAVVFSWFAAISSLAFFLAWLTIIACNWKFHAALKAQNDHVLEKRFSYRAPFWPWASILAFVLFLFMVICSLIIAAVPIDGSPSASNFFANFISVPLFLVMWAGYKIIYWKRCHSKRPEDVDIMTGRREEDPEEMARLEEYANWPLRRKALSYVQF